MPPKKTEHKKKANKTATKESNEGAIDAMFESRERKKKRNMEDFYTSVYGEDRWLELKAALLKEPIKVALYNRYCTLPKQLVLEGLVPLPGSKGAETVEDDMNNNNNNNNNNRAEVYIPAKKKKHFIKRPPMDDFQIKGYYILDYASVLVAEQLDLQPSDSVLDLCAAPGGKSICISQYLNNHNGMNLLTCNEFDRQRFGRLRKTLRDYLPNRNNYDNPYYYNSITYEATCRDGVNWFSPQRYNKILVDAPCSSERHLLLQALELQQQRLASAADTSEEQLAEMVSVDFKLFNEGTSLQLAAIQRSLLLRAIESCADGGKIVYSTCSLSPYENDDVVREALRVSRCEVKVITHTEKTKSSSTTNANTKATGAIAGEATPAGGCLILPDRCNGWGPIYFCVFEKVGNKKSFAAAVAEEDSDDDFLFRKHKENESDDEEESEEEEEEDD